MATEADRKQCHRNIRTIISPEIFKSVLKILHQIRKGYIFFAVQGLEDLLKFINSFYPCGVFIHSLWGCYDLKYCVGNLFVTLKTNVKFM